MEVSSTEQQVAALLKSRDVNLDLNTPEVCHPLPTKANITPVPVLKFVNKKKKGLHF